MRHPLPPAELAGLIASIRDNPDDDAPRLVCADWYEDNGEPERAEFVRVQLERARLPWGDERQAALMSRELRLLRCYAPAWTVGVHPLLKKCRFRRGFPEYAHLHLSHFLHHRRQLMSVAPIRDVSLTGFWHSPEDLVRRVAGCREWSAVERLSIHHQGPHHATDARVLPLLESSHLTHLRALDIRLADFDEPARRRFERLEVLERVESLTLPDLIYDAGPEPWRFDEGGSALANLRSLTAAFGSVTAMRRLTNLPCWDSLTSLSLAGYLPQLDVLDVVARRVPQRLRRLTLTNYRSDVPAPESVRGLAALPLEEFHLSAIELPEAAFRTIFSAGSRWALRRLTLEMTLTADHLRVLAGSPATANLESLVLRDKTTAKIPPGLVPPGVRELAVGDRFQLKNLFPDGRPGLRRLDANGRDRGDEGLTPEKYPDLVWVKLGDTHRAFVGRSGEFPHLGYLNVTAGLRSRFTTHERDALARLGDTAWVTAVDASVALSNADAYALSAPERSPPLDDVPDPP